MGPQGERGKTPCLTSHFYMHRCTLSCRSERGVFMPSARIDLPLSRLYLKSLTFGAHHGWAIAQRVQQNSSDVVRIQHGSLYPALH